MATAVYTTEEVTLQDETTVTLKPLRIAALRVFMKMMDEFGKIESEEEGMDLLVKAAAFCLSKQRPEFWNSDEKTSTEAWEDAADMPTVYKVLDAMGGIKLNDPNLAAAATELLGTT